MKGASINIPRWDGTPSECGTVWELRKGQRIARCSSFTHSKGGEVRIYVDGEWNRGSTAVEGRALLDLALNWRELLHRSG
jgi:hypothetical protein